MHWKSSFVYAVALLGLAPTTEAANSVVFRDAQSGFTFTSYDAAFQIGRHISYRVAIPASATPGQPYDAVLQVVAPVEVGWAGFAWGGGMTRNPLAVNWASGSTPVVSSRWATSHSTPSAYSGATYQILSRASSVNGTHWKVTALCKGCTSWAGSSGTVVLNPAGETRFAFAYSRVRPSGTSPDTSITVHSVTNTWMHDLNGAKNANFDELHDWQRAISEFSTGFPEFLQPRAGKVFLRINPSGASITWGMGSVPEDGYRKPLRGASSTVSTLEPQVVASTTNTGCWSESYKGRGKPLVPAGLDPVDPNDEFFHYITHVAGDFTDGIHPNNRGYRKTAQIRWRSILEADDLGFLTEPHEIEDVMECEETFGDGVHAGGLTQRGSGLDGGTYRHCRDEKGIIHTVKSGWDRNQWSFAQLFSSERDDIPGWLEKSDGRVVDGVLRNAGNEKSRFAKIEDLDLGGDCISAGIHFVDVSGDGLDDFICIANSGEAFAAIIGIDLPVRFADISGTGRSDYVCIEKDGRSWGWTQDDQGKWSHIDQFKFADGMGRANLRWADVDSDSRNDMICIDKFSGDGRVFYNQGRRDTSGFRYEWQPVDRVYQDSQADSCISYPGLDGDGRVDMHGIKHSIDDTAETWFSRCTGDGPGGGGGDNPKKDVRLEARDTSLSYGTTKVWEAFGKLKKHCTSVGCSDGGTLKVYAKIVTKQRPQEMKITISAEGPLGGEGRGTLENMVGLTKAAVQAEGAHGVKSAGIRGSCGAPFPTLTSILQALSLADNYAIWYGNF
ncbi:hypothetical protein DL770_006285 [Monosporascus sp. CRB-9-2]|nr:hypothetical protein DL770_006285 [Monosporascus sp. CRB-9-2]